MNKLILVFFTLLLLPLQAQFDPFSGGNIDQAAQNDGARVVSELQSIAPGEAFDVAVEIKHPKGWHSYYKNPGYIGEGLKIKWTLPEGFNASQIQWPVPHIAEMVMLDNRVRTYGYENTAIFLVTITPPADLPAEVIISGSLDWQICNESNCLPKKKDFSLTLASGEAKKDPANEKLFTEARDHQPVAYPEGWVSSLTEEDNIITLSVDTKGDSSTSGAYIFDEAMQLDAQSEQEFTKTDKGFTLVLKRNLGSADGLVSAPDIKSDKIAGILSLEGSIFAPGVNFSGRIGDNTGRGTETNTTNLPKENTQNKLPTQAASPDEIAQGAALYDANAKIDFVTLDGVQEKELTILTALPLAFLGGLLLNLMPCVFPVLGLKVMGFVSQAGEEEKKVKNHGLVFGAGVVVSMWVLASIIIVLNQIYGKNIGWGGQLTSPWFLAGIIILLFLMGLNMAGVFEFGNSLTSAGGDLQRKKGYSGSFFSGVLTTLIATPCSGPFLGTLMAFTLALKPGPALWVFTIFALGIASPYIILSFFPQLIKKLPRPGAWMESFKVIMSFALFATVAFFMISFISITGANGAGALLFALVLLAFAVWSYGRWFTPMTKKRKKVIWGAAFPALLGVASLALVSSAAKQKAAPKAQVAMADGLFWQNWFPGKIELSRSKKRIIWQDYTADW